jgi:hypothetical protein
MNIIKLLSILAFFLAASVSAQEEQKAQEGDQSAEEQPWEHLEKDESGFTETWVNPNTDWTRFDSLYLWRAEFQYRDVGPARRTRSTMMSTRQREFGISEEDREAFEQIVSEAFVKEIQRAKNFRVTEELGPNTLIMRGAFLDIVSNVPPEHVGRSEIYLAVIGEATLVLELIDAGTGEVAAVVAERRAMGSGRVDSFSMPTNNATIIAEVRRWSKRAASKLRTELEKAIAGK